MILSKSPVAHHNLHDERLCHGSAVGRRRDQGGAGWGIQALNQLQQILWTYEALQRRTALRSGIQEALRGRLFCCPGALPLLRRGDNHTLFEVGIHDAALVEPSQNGNFLEAAIKHCC
jgi:hypothetical protein